MRGTVIELHRGPVLEASLYQRIRAGVWLAMGNWEETGSVGSARPHFEQAWVTALEREGLEQSATLALVRDKLYQRWLFEGAPVTAGQRAAILATRPRARGLLHGLAIVDRDPGEEG